MRSGSSTTISPRLRADTVRVRQTTTTRSVVRVHVHRRLQPSVRPVDVNAPRPPPRRTHEPPRVHHRARRVARRPRRQQLERRARQQPGPHHRAPESRQVLGRAVHVPAAHVVTVVPLGHAEHPRRVRRERVRVVVGVAPRAVRVHAPHVVEARVGQAERPEHHAGDVVLEAFAGGRLDGRGEQVVARARVAVPRAGRRDERVAREQRHGSGDVVEVRRVERRGALAVLPVAEPRTVRGEEARGDRGAGLLRGRRGRSAGRARRGRGARPRAA
jgi:hypothetical protein